MGYTKGYKKDGSEFVRPTGKGAGSTFVNLGKASVREGIQAVDTTGGAINPYSTEMVDNSYEARIEAYQNFLENNPGRTNDEIDDRIVHSRIESTLKDVSSRFPEFYDRIDEEAATQILRTASRSVSEEFEATPIGFYHDKGYQYYAASDVYTEGHIRNLTPAQVDDTIMKGVEAAVGRATLDRPLTQQELQEIRKEAEITQALSDRNLTEIEAANEQWRKTSIARATQNVDKYLESVSDEELSTLAGVTHAAAQTSFFGKKKKLDNADWELDQTVSNHLSSTLAGSDKLGERIALSQVLRETALQKPITLTGDVQKDRALIRETINMRYQNALYQQDAENKLALSRRRVQANAIISRCDTLSASKVLLSRGADPTVIHGPEKLVTVTTMANAVIEGMRHTLSAKNVPEVGAWY